MSTSYYISIKFAASFDRETVTRFLQKGIENGFQYYDFIPDKQGYNAPLINAQEAFNTLINPQYDIDSWGGPCIHTKYQDTYFEMYISEQNKLLDILISIPLPWKAYFNDHHENLVLIDFARYLRLFLHISKEFVITDLNTTIES